MEPQKLASACAAAMWEQDKAAQALGIEVRTVAPGEADLSMTVADHMVNGHGICHGGYIFTLADTAFAYACNTYNNFTVAQHAEITFIAPARQGMKLVAVAKERQRGGRSGVYDISVRADDAGTPIAEFRGLSRTIKGTFFPPERVAGG